MNKIIEFIKKEKGNLSVEFTYRDEKQDAYTIKKSNNKYEVTASNLRSCLYAVYHILDGKPPGEFKAEFPIRGINTVEALARHSPEQIKNLIDRMGRWRMNTLVIHTVYGWNLHKRTIIEECEKRGIDLVFYIYTSLAFLKNCNPKYFARRSNGELIYNTLECETRLCVSNEEGLKELERGCREYFKNELTEEGSILLCPADGLYLCQCPSCCRFNAIEQWEPILRRSVNILKEIKPEAPLESLIYVQRYRVPDDMRTYRRLDRILFDIHRRYRWAAINESHPEYKNPEYEYDPDAVLPTNKYLYKKLKDWRNAFKNEIYIHDNLMLQATLSCPQPNTSILLEDLKLYKKLKLQGVVYEAFEPGIESFASQIKILSDAMWDLNINYTPSEIEKWCLNANIMTGVLYFTKENNFPWDTFKGIYDDIIYTHMKNIADFYDNPSRKTFQRCIHYILEFPERFDILYISFSLFKHLNRKGLLDLTKFTEKERRFIKINKLWDFMETLEEPFEETLEIIKKMKDKV
ncbi:DUF4838 domain-containing protein [Candidatus Calescamantes bacterium]|nr:DUF4838 domain-containing protein [Candidatus Calescamantes bacterium]